MSANEEMSLGEMRRMIERIDREKVDRAAFHVWQASIDQFKGEHQEAHRWLIRSIGVVVIGAFVNLLLLLLPYLGAQ